MILEELAYDQLECQQRSEEARRKANAEQRRVIDEVRRAVDNPEDFALPRVFFVDGPGGTGKTFLENALLDGVRGQGKVALAMAFSGIAAQLLVGGRTSHSRTKCPLHLHEDTICNMVKQSDEAAILREAALIIWDEASMIHRYMLEAVDRLLRDVTDIDNPFGGKTILLAGDFRQVLPIVSRGTRADISGIVLSRSPLWCHFHVLRLTTNMRAALMVQAGDHALAQAQQSFANYLLRIGAGADTSGACMVLPSFILLSDDRYCASDRC